MPESIVQVTEGVGKKLHTFQRTIGANIVEDDVSIIGEPYLASYVATTGAVITTAASHALQIMAGSTLKLRIRRVEVWAGAAATTAQITSMQIMRLTTAGTGGGAVTVSPLDTADAAAGAAAMTLPTVKGTEGAQLSYASFYVMQTIAASADWHQPLFVWDFDRPRSKPLIVPAGAANGIAIKNNNAIAGASVQVVVYFDETNF